MNSLGVVTGNDFQQRRLGILATLGDTPLATVVNTNGTITVTAAWSTLNRLQEA